MRQPMMNPVIDIRMIGSRALARNATAWPPRMAARAMGMRPEAVDRLVLAVVGDAERHAERAEHDRLGDDPAHQELPVGWAEPVPLLPGTEMAPPNT